MYKYLVVDCKNTGDEFITVCETLYEANCEAACQWDCLTEAERKKRHIFVGKVFKDYLLDEAFTENGIDWRAYDCMDVGIGYADFSC